MLGENLFQQNTTPFSEDLILSYLCSLASSVVPGTQKSLFTRTV